MQFEHSLRRNHRGVVISRWPNGEFDPSDEDDRFFAIAQEAELPVHVHIGSFLRTPGRHTDEYVQVLTALLRGEQLNFAGEEFRVNVGAFHPFRLMRLHPLGATLPRVLESQDRQEGASAWL